MLYQSGKLICIGTNSVDNGRIAIRRFARMIQKLGFDVQLNNVTVTNMVATFALNRSINLADYGSFIGIRAYYQPQRFPLLIINYGDKKKANISRTVILKYLQTLSAIKGKTLIESQSQY
ncbi:TATA-box-binding protein-like 1 [Oppia nitens]|uniref:TATA-box-binding protein-like 1 n=1 Tax=Oppia nitens TaxID=1686743 RepID=UPI0023DC8797|nr:TATA-box-binding protein-like 1 [Oppia nitens]